MVSYQADPQVIPVTVNAQHLCTPLGDDSRITIYNGDLQAIAYVGYRPSLKAGDVDAIPIQPLTQGSINADRSTYIVGSAPLTAYLIPGQAFLNPSAAQIAAQIALAGIAPIVASSIVTNPGSSLISVGTPATTGPFPITQPGYEAQIQLAGLSVTESELEVQTQWFDSTSGDTVGNEIYYFMAPNTSFSNFYNLRGPTKANQLQITYRAFNNNVLVSPLWLQNSRVYTQDVGEQTGFNSSAGFTSPNFNPQGGLLMWASINIGAGATQVRAMPFYVGSVFVAASSASATNDFEVQIVAQADQTVATKPVVYDAFTSAAGVLSQVASLPRSQCIVNMINHNAAAKQCVVAIVANPPLF